MKKIKVIGLGKLFQVIHLPNLLKFFSITSCCDPRIELLNKFRSKLKINLYTNNIKEFFKTNKASFIFICSSRAASYKILNQAINSKKTIFCEKPAIFNLEDANKINLKMKSNKQVKFGYMTRYDPSVIFLKKYLIKNKKKLDINKIIFTLSNNSFYDHKQKLNYIRTDEKNDFKFSKVKYPKFIKNKTKIMYHVFLNRYSHVINMVNFFFNKIQPVSMNFDDIYNYHLEAKYKKTKIFMNCNNKTKYLFKIHIFLSDNFEIICNLNNPTKAYSSEIIFVRNKQEKKNRFKKKNIFYEEVKNITNKNDFSATYIKDVIKDLSLVRDFWHLIN